MRPGTRLTYLIFQANSLIDRGEKIPVADVRKWASDAHTTVIGELARLYPFPNLDLSPYEAEDRAEVDDLLQRADYDSMNHYGVKNEGLCLLVACAVQGLQEMLT